MTNLLKALFNKWQGSALSSDVGGRIFPKNTAPIGTQYPFVLYFNIPAGVDRSFTGYVDNYLFQFSLFSDSESSVEISTMYDDLLALFDGCSLTITENRLLKMEKTGSPHMSDDEVTTVNGAGTVAHWAQDFEISVQKS